MIDLRWAAPLAVAALVAAPALRTTGDESATPVEVVEQLHVVLLDVMRQAESLGYQGRYELLAPALREQFDLPFMAEKSVGRYWKDAPPEDQQALVDTFTRYTIATYAGRFDRYSGGEFETLGEEDSARDTKLVRTKIAPPESEEVKLDYRLRQNDGRWLIIDVYHNGTVSELALRRSEYSSLIKRDGFKALLAKLDERIDEMQQSPTDQSS